MIRPERGDRCRETALNKQKSAESVKERRINSGFYDLAIAYQSLHVNDWNRRVPNGMHGGLRTTI